MGTLLDLASLVMIPSGYKEDKLYSVKPTDGSGDFTFSRGTDTATRVNASGLIEKERGNLLQQSNTFDTTWGSNNVTLSGGQSGYDGSSDAWLLTATGSTARLEQSVSSNLNVFSIYAKAGTTDGISLRIIDGGSNPFIFWNLNDGSFAGSTGGGGIDASNQQVTDVGGGWYRIQITNASVTTAMIYVTDASGSLVTSGNIYIQDSMLNAGLVAQPYIQTTTAAVYEGITDNLPRLDYSGGASCPSLLLEPSRTNVVPHSEYLDGIFVPTNMTQTTNYGTSPEGVQNSTRLQLDNLTDSRTVETLTGILTSGVTYTFSCYYKGVSGETTYMYFLDSNGITSVSKKITFTGEWQRESITFEAGTSSNYVYIVDTRQGTSTATDYEVYGAQVEAGSYSTSLIPTYGASASRAVDIANKFSVSDLIGQTEGTVFLDFVYNETSSTNVIFQIRKTTGLARQVDIRIQSNSLRAIANSDGTNQFTLVYGTPITGTRYKIAVRYALNDSTMYVNGTQYGTDTNCDFSAGVFEQITFNEDGSALVEKNSINQALLFKTPLTNDELAALTTL